MKSPYSDSLAHTTFEYKYNIVFAPKFRRNRKNSRSMQKNNIKPEVTLFLKSAEQLIKNINYIKENFGEEYLLLLIVSKNINNLKEVLTYLQEKSFLKVLKSSASIVTLTLEEIKDREEFISNRGEEITRQNGKAFNSIFGWSRRKFKTEKEIFKNVNQMEKESISIQENNSLIQAEKKWYTRILNKLKNLFKRI